MIVTCSSIFSQALGSKLFFTLSYDWLYNKWFLFVSFNQLLDKEQTHHFDLNFGNISSIKSAVPFSLKKASLVTLFCSLQNKRHIDLFFGKQSVLIHQRIILFVKHFSSRTDEIWVLLSILKNVLRNSYFSGLDDRIRRIISQKLARMLLVLLVRKRLTQTINDELKEFTRIIEELEIAARPFAVD